MPRGLPPSAFTRANPFPASSALPLGAKASAARHGLGDKADGDRGERAPREGWRGEKGAGDQGPGTVVKGSQYREKETSRGAVGWLESPPLGPGLGGRGSQRPRGRRRKCGDTSGTGVEKSQGKGVP